MHERMHEPVLNQCCRIGVQSGVQSGVQNDVQKIASSAHISSKNILFGTWFN